MAVIPFSFRLQSPLFSVLYAHFILPCSPSSIAFLGFDQTITQTERWKIDCIESDGVANT